MFRHKEKEPNKPGRLLLWLVLPGLILYSMFDSEKSGGESAEPEVVISTGTLKPGGSLYLSLRDEGIDPTQVHSVVNSLSKHYNLKRSRPGHHYKLSKSTSGDFIHLNYWIDLVNYFTVQKTTLTFISKKMQMPVDVSTRTISGSMGTSLWVSMSDEGVPADLIYKFTEIFAWQVDFLSEPRKGDTFKMVWKRKEVNGKYLGGEIIGASYDGKEAGKIVAVKFKDGFYTPDGESMERQFLRAPLRFRAITSGFKKKRYHPILRKYRPHHGIDYAASRGTPIVAIGDGVVSYKGWKGGNGRLVKILHRNSSYSSAYAHMSRYGKGIYRGKSVKQGQIVGYVGSSGLSTGPHLHFGFEKGGRPINFLRLKFHKARRTVRKADRSKFNLAKSNVMSYLDNIVTVKNDSPDSEKYIN